MALEKGVNCGFVTSAPTSDPNASILVIDFLSTSFKDESPAGAVKVTEIGWWCDNETEEADYDIGIYSHDSANNRPDELLGSALNNAKGTTGGWKSVTGLNITITPSTIYWIGDQVDNTATATNTNYTATPGEKVDYKTFQSSLPDSWGSSSGSNERLIAFYAVYETGGGPSVLDYERKTRGVARGVCRGVA